MPVVKAAMTVSESLKPAFQEYAKTCEQLLRLSGYPLAIKMIEREADIPQLAKRPFRDFGYYLNTGQCFALSRRIGEMIAQKQEDMWCHEPAIGFGFTSGDRSAYEEGLKFQLEGRTRYPDGAKDIHTAKKMAKTYPRFEPDKYVAIVSAPLMRAGFEPDLVVLYVTPVQLNQILGAIMFEWGEDLPCNLSAAAGCVNYVVPAMQRNSFWVSIPCHGDIAFASGQPDELVFSAPFNKVDKLLSAISKRAGHGRGLPLHYHFEPEGWLPKAYIEVAKKMKMHSSPRLEQMGHDTYGK